MAQMILTAIFVVFILVLAAMFIYATMRPDEFRIERSAAIKASPDEIFPLINDFRAWPDWSPWEKRDPNLKRSYGVTTSGQGALYEWSGDRNVGQGRMTITESVPPSRLAIDLHFLKPFKARNVVEFTLEPAPQATRVTWTMHGPVRLMFKIMHLFVDMDRMIGRDFEAGLANLKTLAEQRSRSA